MLSVDAEMTASASSMPRRFNWHTLEACLPLLHQEAARAFIETDHHLVFGFAELESINVVFTTGIWVGQQDHRRGLLDQRCSDVAGQCVLRTLSGKDSE